MVWEIWEFSRKSGNSGCGKVRREILNPGWKNPGDEKSQLENPGWKNLNWKIPDGKSQNFWLGKNPNWKIPVGKSWDSQLEKSQLENVKWKKFPAAKSQKSPNSWLENPNWKIPDGISWNSQLEKSHMENSVWKIPMKKNPGIPNWKTLAGKSQLENPEFPTWKTLEFPVGKIPTGTFPTGKSWNSWLENPGWKILDGKIQILPEEFFFFFF